MVNHNDFYNQISKLFLISINHIMYTEHYFINDLKKKKIKINGF